MGRHRRRIGHRAVAHRGSARRSGRRATPPSPCDRRRHGPGASTRRRVRTPCTTVGDAGHLDPDPGEDPAGGTDRVEGAPRRRWCGVRRGGRASPRGGRGRRRRTRSTRRGCSGPTPARTVGGAEVGHGRHRGLEDPGLDPPPAGVGDADDRPRGSTKVTGHAVRGLDREDDAGVGADQGVAVRGRPPRCSRRPPPGAPGGRAPGAATPTGGRRTAVGRRRAPGIAVDGEVAVGSVGGAVADLDARRPPVGADDHRSAAPDATGPAVAGPEVGQRAVTR